MKKLKAFLGAPVMDIAFGIVLGVLMLEFLEFAADCVMKVIGLIMLLGL